MSGLEFQNMQQTSRNKVELDAHNPTKIPLSETFPPGTVFKPKDPQYQQTVVTKGQTIDVGPGETKHV